MILIIGFYSDGLKSCQSFILTAGFLSSVGYNIVDCGSYIAF